MPFCSYFILYCCQTLLNTRRQLKWQSWPFTLHCSPSLRKMRRWLKMTNMKDFILYSGDKWYKICTGFQSKLLVKSALFITAERSTLKVQKKFINKTKIDSKIRCELYLRASFQGIYIFMYKLHYAKTGNNWNMRGQSDYVGTVCCVQMFLFHHLMVKLYKHIKKYMSACTNRHRMF